MCGDHRAPLASQFMLCPSSCLSSAPLPQLLGCPHAGLLCRSYTWPQHSSHRATRAVHVRSPAGRPGTGRGRQQRLPGRQRAGQDEEDKEDCSVCVLLVSAGARCSCCWRRGGRRWGRPARTCPSWKSGGRWGHRQWKEHWGGNGSGISTRRDRMFLVGGATAATAATAGSRTCLFQNIRFNHHRLPCCGPDDDSHPRLPAHAAAGQPGPGQGSAATGQGAQSEPRWAASVSAVRPGGGLLQAHEEGIGVRAVRPGDGLQAQGK